MWNKQYYGKPGTAVVKKNAAILRRRQKCEPGLRDNRQHGSDEGGRGVEVATDATRPCEHKAIRAERK